MAKNEKMPEAETAPAEDRDVNLMSAKLTVKQLGDPKKAAATFPEGDMNASVLMGYIYGNTKAIRRGKNPDQMSTHNYMVGLFEAEPVFFKDRPLSRAAKCILDGSVQGMIEEGFDLVDDKTGDVLTETKHKVDSLDFKIAVYIRPSSAALGYTWAFKFIQEVTQADPLKALRELKSPDKTKQIAASAKEPIAA